MKEIVDDGLARENKSLPSGTAIVVPRRDRLLYATQKSFIMQKFERGRSLFVCQAS